MDQPTSITPDNDALSETKPLPPTLEQSLVLNNVARAGLKALTEGVEIALQENRRLGIGR